MSDYLNIRERVDNPQKVRWVSYAIACKEYALLLGEEYSRVRNKDFVLSLLSQLEFTGTLSSKQWEAALKDRDLRRWKPLRHCSECQGVLDTRLSQSNLDATYDCGFGPGPTSLGRIHPQDKIHPDMPNPIYDPVMHSDSDFSDSSDLVQASWNAVYGWDEPMSWDDIGDRPDDDMFPPDFWDD